ncbi:AraC family transcriptional regulator [Streptosporangium sp. NPDC051022]|uniref:helix-turn-helix domain-containing protein n=1 Tax=Streptosporangium sp. NPDC051022 TaxID=3155752 RepID=UPI00342AE178
MHEIEVPVPMGLSPFAVGTFDEMGSWSRAAFPHRHVFYEVLYVSAGSGTHTVDFRSTPIRPGTMYFIAPGQVHHWNYDVPMQGTLVLFTEEFLLWQEEPPFFHGLSEHNELSLTGDDAVRMTTLLARMCEEYRGRGPGFASMLQSYLQILLVTSGRLVEACGGGGRGTRSSVLARAFTRLVARHVVDVRSVRAYADRLGVTSGHLAETVREATGRSPGEIIRDALTLEAKRLLAQSDLSIAQIARSLAFEDVSYFGRFFKREAGVTPGHFRREIREKYHPGQIQSLSAQVSGSLV